MKLPANETGIPMTYLANGKQYIVVAIGNRRLPGGTRGFDAAVAGRSRSGLSDS